VRVEIGAPLRVHEVRGSVQTLVWKASEIWIISESRLLESIMNIKFKDRVEVSAYRRTRLIKQP